MAHQSPSDAFREISHINKDLQDSPYELQSFLGNGSFGKVFQGLDRKFHQPCAIKVYVKGDFKQNLQEIIYDEANLLKSLNHPNIVRYLALYETNSRIFLVMELISGGSLKSLVQQRKRLNQKFSTGELKQIMTGIIKAVRYLHQNEIVHRDLKPENILLQNPQDLTSIKIIDFGLSVKFNDVNKNLYLNCGTPLFIAPELKKYKIYSKPVDVWSCGIIFYELCTMGEHPFSAKIKEKEGSPVRKSSFDEEDYCINYPEDLPPYFFIIYLFKNFVFF